MVCLAFLGLMKRTKGSQPCRTGSGNDPVLDDDIYKMLDRMDGNISAAQIRLMLRKGLLSICVCVGPFKRWQEPPLRSCRATYNTAANLAFL